MELIKLIKLSKSLVSLCSGSSTKNDGFEILGLDVDTLTKAMVSAELVDYVIGRSRCQHVHVLYPTDLGKGLQN